MKKGTSKAVRYILAGCVAVLCVIMAGCGCGKKKTDPSAAAEAAAADASAADAAASTDGSDGNYDEDTGSDE